MLHARNVPFRIKDSFEIFFLCDFFQLFEFDSFLIALGKLLLVFQAVEMLLNVWFMIWVCAFNRI